MPIQVQKQEMKTYRLVNARRVMPQKNNGGKINASRNQERAEGTVTTENPAKDGIKEVTIRSAKISELCTKHGCADKAAEFIRSGASVEQVQDAILDTIQARTVPCQLLHVLKSVQKTSRKKELQQSTEF